MNHEKVVDMDEKRDGFGYKVLLKLAAAFGIGWQVMLVVVRIIGYLVAPAVGLIIGFASLFLFPEAHGALIAAAFILPPLLTIGATELFIWFYQSPVDALTY